jgi:hypothetical protein
MKIAKSLIAAIIVAAALHVSAQAAVINFNNLAGTSLPGASYVGGYTQLNGGTALQLGGMTFNSNNYHYAIGTAYSGSDAGYAAYNGSDFYLNNGFTLTSASATPFALNKLDLAAWYNTTGGTATLSGTKAGGGTVNQVVDFSMVTNYNNLSGNDFTTYTLQGFDNLTSFSATSSVGYFVADNIVINATSVPEPGSLTLFGLGLAAFAALRRNSRKQA